MRDFWTYIGNGKYNVGCDGQTVYLFDGQGSAIAEFKGLIYAYDAAISPKDDIFVVKSNTGVLAVYSFEPPSLKMKFRFGKTAYAHNGGVCFSPDGSELYDIEELDYGKNALAVYDTSDFSLKYKYTPPQNHILSGMEYDEATDAYYILGFIRSENDLRYFIGKLSGGEIRDAVSISEREHSFYDSYLSLKTSGFTKKRFGWSHLFYMGYDYDALKNTDHTLAKLWAYYHGK